LAVVLPENRLYSCNWSPALLSKLSTASAVSQFSSEQANFLSGAFFNLALGDVQLVIEKLFSLSPSLVAPSSSPSTKTEVNHSAPVPLPIFLNVVNRYERFFPSSSPSASSRLLTLELCLFCLSLALSRLFAVLKKSLQSSWTPLLSIFCRYFCLYLCPSLFRSPSSSFALLLSVTGHSSRVYAEALPPVFFDRYDRFFSFHHFSTRSLRFDKLCLWVNSRHQ
jgi:hypothetical protein